MAGKKAVWKILRMGDPLLWEVVRPVMAFGTPSLCCNNVKKEKVDQYV